ncbi:hypothetical protein [Desertivirga arenae]|uniref:hypothetical protein n=1 Tax=Desertivirga arenae TaxID=2810309 RepID=UPI001A9723D1|nr:hypothetical protein [Pedobacter sp. SYSU D00823]
MNSVICTLFEKNYHYGLAALANSLYNNGYRGSIYAGYRGDLPPWAKDVKKNAVWNWENSSSIDVGEGLRIYFLPLSTDYHLTNYKPDFMLQLLDGPAFNANKIYYFDPDIVITKKWSLYETWVEGGVALCEDVNSPMPKNHPRRQAWRKFYGERNITLTFKDAMYANGGFVGLHKRNKDFLIIWKIMQEKMATLIGGLNRSALSGEKLHESLRHEFSPFPKTDQDALNAAVEAWDGDISFVGQEGMAFKPGASLMSHALGQPKPWNWKPIKQIIQGSRMNKVYADYWNFANEPIMSQPNSLVWNRKIAFKVSRFIARFYSR